MIAIINCCGVARKALNHCYAAFSDSGSQARLFRMCATWMCLIAAMTPQVPVQPSESVDGNNRSQGFREIGSIEIESDGQQLYYHQNLILVAAGTDGLILVDVSKPASPLPIGQVAISDMAVAVTAEGTRAYVSAGPAGWPIAILNVVDIQDPRAPKVVGRLDMPDYPAGLAVSDEVVYVADRSEGLRIVSVADPTSPREIAAVTDIGFANEVILSGTNAFVLGDEGTVRAFDISSPDAPVALGRFQFSNEVGGLAVSGDSAFVCMGDSGVAVLDVSDPSQMGGLRRIDTPGVALGVLATSDRLVVADLDGLSVARGKNHADVQRAHTDESRLTFDLAEGNGYVFVLDGLEPTDMYGMFGKIAIRVVQIE